MHKKAGGGGAGERTVFPANLALGNDQLARVRVVGVGQRVLEDADGAQDLANRLDLAGKVGRVANDKLGLGRKLDLVVAVGHGGLDAHRLAIVVLDLVDVGVEHVGAAVDGRQAGKALGQLAQTVEGVDVR